MNEELKKLQRSMIGNTKCGTENTKAYYVVYRKQIQARNPYHYTDSQAVFL